MVTRLPMAVELENGVWTTSYPPKLPVGVNLPAVSSYRFWQHSKRHPPLQSKMQQLTDHIRELINARQKYAETATNKARMLSRTSDSLSQAKAALAAIKASEVQHQESQRCTSQWQQAATELSSQVKREQTAVTQAQQKYGDSVKAFEVQACLSSHRYAVRCMPTQILCAVRCTDLCSSCFI